MAAVAFGDLSRKGFDPAAWEGLHYLYLGVPALLVVVAQHVSPVNGTDPKGTSASQETRRDLRPRI